MAAGARSISCLPSLCSALLVPVKEPRAKKEGPAQRAKGGHGAETRKQSASPNNRKAKRRSFALSSLRLAHSPLARYPYCRPIVTFLCNAIASWLSGSMPMALAAYFLASPMSPRSKKMRPNSM